MKRLQKIAENNEGIESLIKNIDEFKIEVIEKIDKIFSNNETLIEELLNSSFHTKYEKDIDVIVNESRENISYLLNKIQQLQQKVLGENGVMGDENE